MVISCNFFCLLLYCKLKSSNLAPHFDFEFISGKIFYLENSEFLLFCQSRPLPFSVITYSSAGPFNEAFTSTHCSWISLFFWPSEFFLKLTMAFWFSFVGLIIVGKQDVKISPRPKNNQKNEKCQLCFKEQSYITYA